MRISNHASRGGWSGGDPYPTSVYTLYTHTLIYLYTHTLIYSYTHTPHTLIPLIPLIHLYPSYPSYPHTLIHSYTHIFIHSYTHTLTPCAYAMLCIKPTLSILQSSIKPTHYTGDFQQGRVASVGGNGAGEGVEVEG
jgi:hypothetical protein